MTKPRIIELKLLAEAVDPERAVLPSEVEGPTSLEIRPEQKTVFVDGVPKGEIHFRIAFEPDNRARRLQPYRDGIDPVFPDGWKYGDPYPNDPSRGRVR